MVAASNNTVGVVASLASGVAKEICKFATHRMDLDMKREMMDRRMSAEEIERAIGAGEVWHDSPNRGRPTQMF